MTTDHAVLGFDAAGMAAGIKKNGKSDLAIIASRVPCRAAAIFTKNQFPAASVIYNRQLLSFNPEMIYGVVVNSGCANACTGVMGNVNTRLMAEQAEKYLGAGDSTVFVMNTGVIGVQLPMPKINDGIAAASQKLAPDGWLDAATAIMTTDTRPKLATRTVSLGEATVTLTGMVKGAGMIHPDMATMLSVVATDGDIAQPLLQQALVHAGDRSFNRISVDGDTSTNDTVLLLANGLAGNEVLSDETQPDFIAFQAALTDLCTELAQAVVRDGEGATKFIAITVAGAESDSDAHAIANTIATSPLVKTAFTGGDANWGRILAAAGRAGVIFDPTQVTLSIAPGANGAEAGLQLVVGGIPTDYAEADAAAIFAQQEISVLLDLGGETDGQHSKNQDKNQGKNQGKCTVWTCDLSHDYVSINGDYRT
jgi:glutamate N-acetyltransferase/amino-acid N-acetyltransferase